VFERLADMPVSRYLMLLHLNLWLKEWLVLPIKLGVIHEIFGKTLFSASLLMLQSESTFSSLIRPLD